GATLILLFIALSSMGLAFPNAAALSLAPFDHNIGSSSAMLGFLQIGVSSLASASIGLFDSHGLLPVAAILAVTAGIGLGIYLIGMRRIGQLRFMEEKGAHPLAH
ncbi:MAG TPA: Bcr/CflA family drug resistance efflux transporter, partial [Verrucomicrobiae bacterium]